MVPKRARSGKKIPGGVFVVLFFLVAGLGLVLFKSQLLDLGTASRGLSGLVSVRGSVSLEELNLSAKEIGVINKAVSEHRNTFTKVDLIVDSTSPKDEMSETTTLEFAIALHTNEALVVKSWSSKIKRGKMAAQVVSYMRKAAREYKEFKRFPDVKKNFKTLYI